jgi:hypothetical protein
MDSNIRRSLTQLPTNKADNASCLVKESCAGGHTSAKQSLPLHNSQLSPVIPMIRITTFH